MSFKLKYKSIFPLLVIAFISLGFWSCQKASINGDLDGRWQILEIETTEGIEQVKDKQLYYNFYMHVCNLSYYGGIFAEANFNYENNFIKLSFPHINYSELYYRLNQYGIYSNPVEFKVVYLDKKKLVMENDKSLITCRKF